MQHILKVYLITIIRILIVIYFLIVRQFRNERPLLHEKDYQDKEGVLLWEFDLNPRAKQEINMEFVVTYPKDAPVFGL
jgi:hypothetical protein